MGIARVDYRLSEKHTIFGRYFGAHEASPPSQGNVLRLRWYDHWLKGIENGVEKEAPVHIFVMGGGEPHKTPEGRLFVGGRWRDEREWPLARAVSTPYYIHADGSLSKAKPSASQPTSYRFDPADPVPTLGGNVSSEGALMLRGAQEQRCLSVEWVCKSTLLQYPDRKARSEISRGVGRTQLPLWWPLSSASRDCHRVFFLTLCDHPATGRQNDLNGKGF